MQKLNSELDCEWSQRFGFSSSSLQECWNIARAIIKWKIFKSLLSRGHIYGWWKMTILDCGWNGVERGLFRFCVLKILGSFGILKWKRWKLQSHDHITVNLLRQWKLFKCIIGVISLHKLKKKAWRIQRKICITATFNQVLVETVKSHFD